jgi:hypothetical protein
VKTRFQNFAFKCNLRRPDEAKVMMSIGVVNAGEGAAAGDGSGAGLYKFANPL